MIAPKTQAIIDYKRENPCVPPVTIARKYKVSRQRVSSIFKRAGIKASTPRRGLSKVCPLCGGHKDSHSAICRSCYKERHWVTCICAGCGKVFQRRQSEVLRSIGEGAENLYCGKKCRGEALGSSQGFGTHPENIYGRLHVHTS